MSDTNENMGDDNGTLYGSNPLGARVVIGEAELMVDDDFQLATMLAIVAVLNQVFPDIDQIISTTAANIYDEIQKNRLEQI
jgi:hypothetical protein